MGLVNKCFRLYHGNTAEGSAHALLPGQWNSYRQFEKFIAQDGDSAVLAGAANPVGHYLPEVWHPPITVGEMSMRTDGAGSMAANLIPTRAMSVDLTGAGDLDATAALAAALALSMTGSGGLSATIQGRLNMALDLSGSGDFAADMEGIASMAIDMLGAGDLDATIAAYGNMAIDIVVTGTGLSTANVGESVWAYVFAELDAIPGATPKAREAFMLLYQALRNKRDTTASADEIHDDAGNVIGDATLADDGTTFTKGKYS